MVVLAVLLISWLVLRAAGAFGAKGLTSWRDSGRSALAIMFVFTGAAHFTSLRHDLARMVPAWIPFPDAIIFITGILEIAGAIGLILSKTRKLAGVCLSVLLVAMFAANAKAAQEGLAIGGTPAITFLPRLLMQILFIGLALWSTDPTEARGHKYAR